jgi:hypothetical protein
MMMCLMINEGVISRGGSLLTMMHLVVDLARYLTVVVFRHFMSAGCKDDVRFRICGSDRAMMGWLDFISKSHVHQTSHRPSLLQIPV